MEADEERDDSHYAEGAVNQAPVGWYSADRAGDEGEGDDSDAGDDAELDDPLVTDGVDEWTEEGNRDNDMGEGQPVGAVGHKGIGLIGVNDPVVYASQPGVQGGFARWRRSRGHVEEAIENVRFVFQRKGSDAAEDQPNDEENKP